MVQARLTHLERGINVIAEYGNASIGANMADDLRGGGAAVYKDDIIVFNERSRQFADQMFFFGMLLCPQQILGLQGQPLVEDGPPMGSFNNACPLQPFQVPAHRRLGSIQHVIQIVHPNDLMGCQVLLDPLSSLRWNERFAH